MRLSNIYNNPEKPVISFEVFPPKTDEGIDKLTKELALLKKYDPGFISVTYGAGGSTQGRSLKVIKKIVKDLGLAVMPHLTCIGSSPDSIKDFINKISEYGIESILALRGDYPQNNPEYKAESDYFKYAQDLVAFTHDHFDFDIAVAGFPEMHPEAKDMETDLAYLKQKVDQGASAIMTQLFFNNEDYFKYVEKLQSMGIDIPVIPGIWTLTGKSQVEKLPTLCNSKLPEKLVKIMNDNSKSDDYKVKSGIEYAVNQINQLIAYGVKGIHLYTLNRAGYVSEVLENINK